MGRFGHVQPHIVDNDGKPGGGLLGKFSFGKILSQSGKMGDFSGKLRCKAGRVHGGYAHAVGKQDFAPSPRRGTQIQRFPTLWQL